MSAGHLHNGKIEVHNRIIVHHGAPTIYVKIPQGTEFSIFGICACFFLGFFGFFSLLLPDFNLNDN